MQSQPYQLATVQRTPTLDPLYAHLSRHDLVIPYLPIASTRFGCSLQMNTPGLLSLLHSQVLTVIWSYDIRFGVAVSWRCEASIRYHAFFFSRNKRQIQCSDFTHASHRSAKNLRCFINFDQVVCPECNADEVHVSCMAFQTCRTCIQASSCAFGALTPSSVTLVLRQLQFQFALHTPWAIVEHNKASSYRTHEA